MGEPTVNPRLAHDAAWAASLHVLEALAPLLGEGERGGAFDLIYARVRAGIEAYCARSRRERERLETNGGRRRGVPATPPDPTGGDECRE